MNKTTKKRAMSGEEKRTAVKKILLSTLVIAFFVAIIISYYNMLYKQTRDSIIKDGQIAAMQSTDYLNEYLSVAIHAVELTSYTLDDMIKNNRTNEEILEYLKWQSTAVSSTVFENFTGIYGYINNTFLDSTGWAPDPNEVLWQQSVHGTLHQWQITENLLLLILILMLKQKRLTWQSVKDLRTAKV